MLIHLTTHITYTKANIKHYGVESPFMSSPLPNNMRLQNAMAPKKKIEIKI